MLRQPAALAAKKRAEKEDEWEKLQEERAKLAANIEEKEVILIPHTYNLVLRVYTRYLPGTTYTYNLFTRYTLIYTRYL